MSIIDMQTMRYINLLDRISHVKTRKCFIYNNTIIFAVPKNQISRAIGPSAINIKKLQEKLEKKIRIIEEAEGIEDAEFFISDIVSPTKFESLEVKDREIVISAGGTQSKAALLGRNKRRFLELEKIVKGTFGLELRIV